MISESGSATARIGSSAPQLCLVSGWETLPFSVDSEASWLILFFLLFFFGLAVAPFEPVPDRPLDEMEALMAANSSLQYCICPSLAPFSIGPAKTR
jgi:hypothetical protein